PAAGAGTLSFQMWVGTVTTPFTDTLVVRVDGNVVQTFTELATAESGYTLRTIPVTFAAAGSHTVLFTYTGATTGTASFSVDNVSLTTGGACATPTPGVTPTPVTSPTPTPVVTPTPVASPSASPCGGGTQTIAANAGTLGAIP